MVLNMEIKQEMKKVNLHINDNKIRWYSLLPIKYLEREGIKDIGTNFWNQGRTEEIAERVLHLD